jgi:L-ascorbate 6-phosphate lactonase
MRLTAPPLQQALQKCVVPKGSVALAWLGQAGFILKSPGGHLLAIDPYLSNSCAAIGRSVGVNMERQVPAPLRPRDLVACDTLIFTHSHQDHVDPETVGPYLDAGGEATVIAPHEAAARLESIGVPLGKIVRTWPNNTHTVEDFTIKATFAIPLGGDDLTHVGFLVQVKGGPRLYFTGDTDYNDILPLSVAPHQPDIMITVINPAFRNLSPSDAARLAKEIRPRWVIPCHHDLFPDNSLPPQMLRTNLMLYGMQHTYCEVPAGEVRLFKGIKKHPTLA